MKGDFVRQRHCKPLSSCVPFVDVREAAGSAMSTTKTRLYKQVVGACSEGIESDPMLLMDVVSPLFAVRLPFVHVVHGGDEGNNRVVFHPSNADSCFLVFDRVPRSSSLAKPHSLSRNENMRDALGTNFNRAGDCVGLAR